MKTKSDYITNSSSTSYIISIPKKFNIEKCIEYMAENEKFEYIDGICETLDDYKKELTRIFNDLKTGDILYEYECDYEIYNEIIDMICNNKLCIEKLYIPSDCGRILNINSPKHQDMINGLELEIFKYES